MQGLVTRVLREMRNLDRSKIFQALETHRIESLAPVLDTPGDLKENLIKLLLSSVTFDEIEEANSLGDKVTEIFAEHRRALYVSLEKEAAEEIARQRKTTNFVDGDTIITGEQARVAVRLLLRESQEWPENDRFKVTQLMSMCLLSIRRSLELTGGKEIRPNVKETFDEQHDR